MVKVRHHQERQLPDGTVITCTLTPRRGPKAWLIARGFLVMYLSPLGLFCLGVALSILKDDLTWAWLLFISLMSFVNFGEHVFRMGFWEASTVAQGIAQSGIEQISSGVPEGEYSKEQVAVAVAFSQILMKHLSPATVYPSLHGYLRERAFMPRVALDFRGVPELPDDIRLEETPVAEVKAGDRILSGLQLSRVATVNSEPVGSNYLLRLRDEDGTVTEQLWSEDSTLLVGVRK